MGPPVRLRTRLWLGGLAAGGVAVAHVLAFLLVAPDPLRRERLLEATGHGAWPLIVMLAMGALVAALAGFSIGTARASVPWPQATLWRAAASRLVLLQVAGFLALEVLERLAMGQGLTGVAALPAEPVIPIGVAAQFLVALASSVLLIVLIRVVDRLVHLLHRLPRGSGETAVTGPGSAVRLRGRIVTDPANPRGPPRRILSGCPPTPVTERARVPNYGTPGGSNGGSLSSRPFYSGAGLGTKAVLRAAS